MHALESASVAFWNHLLSKYIFTGKNWILAPEASPAEIDRRRRVDLVIKYVGETSIEVLCFHELKPLRATANDVQDVEHQAYAACQAYIAQHDLSNVYALTSIGTKARAWTCTEDSDYLEPMFGSHQLAEESQYIEAHSTEAETLRNAFGHMKRFPPTGRKGIAYGNRSPEIS